MQPKILLVDDEPSNLQLLRQILKDDYQLFFAKDGKLALQLAEQEQPDLILLDVMMPDMDGLETCCQLKNNPLTRHIPVIFVSALNEVSDESMGFEVGGVDYISKPIKPAIVKARVRTHLALVDIAELRRTQLQIIECLGRAAEYKDDDTGKHVSRMSRYSQAIALAAGFTADKAELLLHAVPMHDVGKIGIPDSILMKPGPLTPEEWVIMKKHAEIGVEIIGDDPAELFKVARIVAQNHHEKWNGSGYPQGLKGQEIPIEARIAAIADVFDALTNKRPYKPAWPLEESLAYIQEQSGKHFDPELVKLFLENLPTILDIKNRYTDETTPLNENIGDLSH